MVSKKITVVKNSTLRTQIIVSSFDEGVRAQNHSLQSLDFIVLYIKW